MRTKSTNQINQMDKTSKVIGILLIISAGGCFGAIPLFVTWLNERNIGVWTQVAARLLISVVIFLVFTVLFARNSIHISNRAQLTFLAVNGILVFAGITTYIFSITLGTSPIKAILLIYLYPIFAVALGTIFLKESLTKRKLTAAIIGIFGAALTLKFWEIQNLGQFQVGDLFAVANGMLYACIVVFGRRGSFREEMHPLSLTLWSFSFALGGLVLVTMITMIFQGVPRAIAYLQFTPDFWTLSYLLGLAFVSTALPYILLYAGLKRIGSGVASILLLSEPVSVFLLASIFLGETIGWWQVAGGLVILGAGILIAK